MTIPMRGLLLAALLVAARSASAEAAKTTSGPVPAKANAARASEQADDQYGHARQLHLRTEILGGYRMLFRYDKSPRCAPYDYGKSQSDQQKFCGYGASPALGIALGYSAVDFFEPFVFMQFGLSDEASQTNLANLLRIGVGARLYTMSDSRFKIFFAPWVALDTTSGPKYPIGPGNPGDPGFDDAKAGVVEGSYRTDLLVHLEIGPQYDLSRAVGVYLAGGLTFQMLRYLGASADLAVGVQLRAP